MAMRVKIHLVRIQRSVMLKIMIQNNMLYRLCYGKGLVLHYGTHKVEWFEKSLVETSFLVAYKDMNRIVLKMYLC